jgi:predicted ester cyclase
MKQPIHAMSKAGSVLLLMVVLVATGLSQQQQLKPAVEKYVAIWNTGDFKDLESIMDPHFVRHANDDPAVEGVDGMKKVISGLKAGYPDVKVVLTDEIYVENRSIARWSLTGTNTGAGEMPPTGKAVKQWGISIIRFANGKLAEEWVAFDNQSFLHQLGFTLTPPAEKKK